MERYKKEFDDFEIPQEIIELIAAGKLRDISHHRDACPSFIILEPGKDRGKKWLLWVESAEPARRIPPIHSPHHFEIQAPDFSYVLKTNDITEVISWISKFQRS